LFEGGFSAFLNCLSPIRPAFAPFFFYPLLEPKINFFPSILPRCGSFAPQLLWYLPFPGLLFLMPPLINLSFHFSLKAFAQHTVSSTLFPPVYEGLWSILILCRLIFVRGPMKPVLDFGAVTPGLPLIGFWMLFHSS